MLDVVVPSAGVLGTVERCLDRLRVAVDRAGIPRDRVIVVDDAPGRGDLDLVAGSRGFRTVVGGRRSAGAARNLGASSGDGPWILFVDDDIALDEQAIARALRHIDERAAALIGGLRPPRGAPSWLRDAYIHGTVTPASAYAPDGGIPGHQLSSALLAVQREVFVQVGGFPELPEAGWEDALFGLRLEALGMDLMRVGEISGTHHYLPSWEAWLRRNRRAGSRLAALEGRIGDEDLHTLLRAVRLENGLRAAIKRAIAVVPDALLLRARGSLLRRMATSAAFADGFLRYSMTRRADG